MRAPTGYILVKGNRYDEKFENSNLYRYFQSGRETWDVNYHAEVVAVPDDTGDDITVCQDINLPIVQSET